VDVSHLLCLQKLLPAANRGTIVSAESIAPMKRNPRVSHPGPTPVIATSSGSLAFPPRPQDLGGQVSIIEFPKVADHRGNLSFVEGGRHLPYLIKRAYYLYDVPAGAVRGGHAHKICEECIIAASGSFTVVIDDGLSRKEYFLNRPHYGLYIPRMVWRELENFSSGSICLVFSSEEYDESDYYREYDEFKAAFERERGSSFSGPSSGIPGAKT